MGIQSLKNPDRWSPAIFLHFPLSKDHIAALTPKCDGRTAGSHHCCFTTEKQVGPVTRGMLTIQKVLSHSLLRTCDAPAVL